MGRHSCEVRSESATDTQAVIGFDPPLRTFFLHAFVNEETDEPELWLGTLLEEYPSLESIVEAARQSGYEVSGLQHEAILSMTKEAGQQHAPSIAERHGFVR